MVEIFSKLLDKIKTNKELKESGKVTSIAFPFSRLNEHFPGWERSTQTIITASSGIGKTKLAKFLTITNTFNFIKQHPEIQYKVFYFALEESKDNFWLGMISTMLYEKYGIELSPTQLKSLGKFTMTNDVFSKVEECRETIEEMTKYIEVVDFIFNPFGIFKYVKTWFDNPENGEYEFDNNTNERVTKRYNYKNPNLWVFVVTDHIGLLSPENGENQHACISRYSKDYCLKKFTKLYQCCTILIQQQAASQEQQQYTNQGQSIEEKLEPSLDGLGINKNTQQEADMVLGLFAPHRYNLARHRGYDIKRMGNKYRSCRILKDRNNGLDGKCIPLYFNGATNTFKELDKATEIDYDLIT
jgi:replicative DNA helicase